MTNAQAAPATPMRYERKARSSDGIALAWRDYGPADGRTIVLCHGLAANGDQFDADAAHFARLGFRVIVPDLRGHGRSEVPPGCRPEDFTIPRMARDLVEILDASGAETVDFVGNSLGGILALQLLGEAPQRFRSVALFGTALGLGLPRGVGLLLPWSYRLLGKKLVSDIGARGTTRNLEARPLVARILADFDPRVGQAVADNVARYDLSQNMRDHAGPVLMICGDLDGPVNWALRKALPELKTRETITIVDMADAGHCANLDQPERFRETLEAFWART